MPPILARWHAMVRRRRDAKPAADHDDNPIGRGASGAQAINDGEHNLDRRAECKSDGGAE